MASATPESSKRGGKTTADAANRKINHEPVKKAPAKEDDDISDYDEEFEKEEPKNKKPDIKPQAKPEIKKEAKPEVKPEVKP